MNLLWLSLTFIAGILLGAVIALPSAVWLYAAGVLFIVSITRPLWLRFSNHIFGERHNLIPMPIPVLILIAALGGARYQSSLPNLSDPNFIANFNDNGEKITVTGVITAFPDLRDTYTNLRIEAQTIHPYGTVTGQREIHGTLQARIDPYPDLHYGDRVVISGYLKTPPENEDFSYRDYLARQGVYSYLSGAKITLLGGSQGYRLLKAVYAIKEKALATTYQLWPDPEASLLAGILLGVESGIPTPVTVDFKNTGTSHIIAISGFNITIIAGLFASTFGRIWGPRKGAVAAVLGIGLYTLLVGADAAVVRAAIMGGLALFARQVGRRPLGLSMLLFTAAAMTLFNPDTLWDLGFQLSFAATLGLILYAEPLANRFTRLVEGYTSKETANKISGPVSEYFLFTIAAQITTLPLMAYHFGRISWIALIANPVILPVQPPIMTLGGAAVILGIIWQPLGALAAHLVWPFVLFTIRAVEFFGTFAGGSLPIGELGIFWLLLFYGVLLTCTFASTMLREQLLKLKPAVYLTILSIGTIIIWRAALTAPDDLLHITMLDVGSGDALFIETPGGRNLLINGGPSPALLANGLGRRMPPFGREMDWLVIASPRLGQVEALPRTLERYPPAQVLWAGPSSAVRAADYLRKDLTRMNIPVTKAVSGQVLDLGDGAALKVVACGDQGAILLLTWRNFHALLPLGANANDLKNLNIGQVDILMLASQGYAPLNPPEWISMLNPRLTLLSVAADDRSGLPDDEVLDALGGGSLLRTDKHGWVEITTNGEQVWAVVEKR
ncbi:MAG: ComEC/Rec2 family competence protein [Chloroflexota bacterium]